ncbi:diguanylate cyclase (GGDEF)-like protein/PAS domain S-box-containing protein [Methylohalomonas lacus]|uniref:cyclic-guanylate-specific phosphodiesterase n=1 Tax=Methylohalomonas lacus TaxID=398773 RepID=A0AAE3HMA1_9GAMM|nr:EAL domain-containing protein [Methylohalomonas lacus]MCS3903577.1 diguanylate cyclase (GGDEF)-like protein/PAS domain S-box-containing protein [Methylohalomonas lacus]
MPRSFDKFPDDHEYNRELLAFAVNAVHDGVYLIDANGCFVYVNQAACRALGYSRETLESMGISDIDPDFPMAEWPDYWQKMRTEGTLSFESRHKTHGGLFLNVEINASSFDFGGHEYCLALSRDITQRKAVEKERAVLGQAVNNVHEGIYLIDSDARILYVNQEACRALGYAHEELQGMTIPDLDPEFSFDRWYHHWQKTAEAGQCKLQTTHRRKDGSRFPVEISATHFSYMGQEYHLSIARDISERKAHEERIKRLAYYDSLTGLPNRALVIDRLRHALAHAERHEQLLAVLFLDLDRFKHVNDALGHGAGDQLLVQVGRRLTQFLRQADTVGRLGGDEFLVLLTSPNSAEDVVHVVGRLHNMLSAPYELAEHQFNLTVSIGISLFPRDAVDAETLIKYADNALYIAKDTGRNSFHFFNPAMDQQMHERIQLEHDLRSALENDEFLLYYQPQYDLNKNIVTGAEALIRWQHPTRGLLLPGQFITIAEDTGLICQMGEWVLRTACSQARFWHENGYPDLLVSVNLSSRQLSLPDFTARVKAILAETGCNPARIEMEITESSVMAQPETAIAQLAALQELGLNLAMDDFGTGYSSLGYLKRFPLNRLKIDRGFISGIPDDGNDVVITQTIILMARQLGLSVVAEGVETEAQKTFLLENDCANVQGFLMGRPEVVETFNQHLQAAFGN